MSKPPARKQPLWLWIGLGAVVLVALVAALVASAGGGDEPDPGTQSRPVTATGSPLPVLPSSGGDPAIGMVAPELDGSSFDGTDVAIEHGSGKLVLVVAHWCPHCRNEIPILADHLEKTDLPGDVELVTVSTSVSQERPNFPPSKWLRDEGWVAPVLADDTDGTAARAYGVSGFPFLIGLSHDGKVVGRVTGEFPTATFDALARAVAEADARA